MSPETDLFDPALSKQDRRRLLRELAAQQEEEERAALLRSFDEESLMWLALSPGWTIEAANACRFAGAGRGGALELFSRMREAGILDVFDPPELDSGRTPEPPFYTITQAARATLLDPYRISVDGDLPRTANAASHFLNELRNRFSRAAGAERLPGLRKMVAEIGQRVEQLSGKGVPPVLARWAGLASAAYDSGALVERLDARTSAATHQKLADAVREIHDDIEAVKSLAWLMGGEGAYQLQLAMLRAGRRLELLQRRKRDQQHLTHFLPRQEQIAAFFGLMDAPDDQWALHLAGAGGVGKTMLVRYISSGLTGDAPPERTPRPDRVLTDVAVVRVDFDYLNPDFPLLAPGLLLWSFGQELRPHDSSHDRAAIQHFDEADRILDELHKMLRAYTASGAESPTRNEQFFQATKLYIEGFRALGKRVLLILDTCEELAKAAAGSALHNVEETFRILRALHDGPRTLFDDDAPAGDGVGSLRVILSGRRPLSRRGVDWETDATALKPQAFLQLHELRGFAVGDAERFLRECGASDDLIPAVVERSTPDAGSPFPIRYTVASRAPQEFMRCNPYDLRLYLDWVRERPPPTAETIRSATGDQYVDLRIVGRLADDELKAVLPAVALLVHFDRDSLGRACGLDDEPLDRVFRKLEDVEWTEIHTAVAVEGARQRSVLSVKRGVQGRLITYFERRGGVVQTVWARAADHLERVTLEADLETLDWLDFDTAARVLEKDLPRAVVWWRRIEARMLVERDAKWALRIVELLLGADGAIARTPENAPPEVPAENALRPFVLATQALALALSGSAERAAGLWSEVEIEARAERGRSEAHAVLVRRAVACGFTAAVQAGRAIEPVAIERLTDAMHDALASTDFASERASAWIAAAEAMVELAERLQDDGAAFERLFAAQPAEGAQTIPALALAVMIGERTWASHNAATEAPRESQRLSELAAFACSIAARAGLLLGRVEEARTFFDHAHRLTPDSGLRQTRWTDWRAPDSIPDRVRLEYLRHASALMIGPLEAITAVDEGNRAAVSETIDGERRASMTLQLRLAESVVDARLLAPWFDADRGVWRLSPDTLDAGLEQCNAHRGVPPLFVPVAEAIAATEWAPGAVKHLEDMLEQGSRYRFEIVCHVARTLLGIAVALRFIDENTGRTAETALRRSDDPRDRYILLKKSAFDGAKAEQSLDKAELAWLSTSPLGAHCVWQTRSHADHTLSGHIDQSELARLLSVHIAKAGPYHAASLVLDLRELAQLPGAPPAPAPDASIASTGATRLRGLQALEIELRTRAIDNALDSQSPGAEVENLRVVGVRRAAQLALELGELLSLRLPALAAGLFDVSGPSHERCGDRLGQLRCAVLAMLVRARAARMRSDAHTMTDAFERVRLAYQAFVDTGIARLPAWDGLLAFERAPDADAFDTFPAMMRPWLARVLLCIHLARRAQSGPDDDTNAFADWLALRYGSPRAAGAGLAPVSAGRANVGGASKVVPLLKAMPFELDGWAAAAAEPQPAAPGDSAAAAAPQAEPAGADVKAVVVPPWWTWARLKTAAQVLVGLALFAGIVWGVFRATLWVVDLAAPVTGGAVSHKNLWWQVGIVGGLWAAAMALSGILRQASNALESLVASSSALSVKLRPRESAGGATDSKPALDVDMLLVRRKLRPFPFPVIETAGTAKLKTEYLAREDGSQVPLEALGSGPEAEAFKASLQRILQRLGSRCLIVQLDAPSGTSAQPLEAGVLHTLSTYLALEVPPRSLSFIRNNRSPAESRTVAGDPFGRVVWHGAGVRGEDVLAAFRPSERRRIALASELPDPEAAALVLDGIFDLGTAGVRFIPGDSTPGAVSSSTERGERGVSAERLARQYTRAHACILHYGVGEAVLGTELGRRQAQLARMFAAELAREGMGLLVAVPRGPAKNVRVLLEAMRRKPYLRPDAVARALFDIRQSYGASPGDADAAALGMCLMVDRGILTYPLFDS